MSDWYQLSTMDALAKQSSEQSQGLSRAEAARRLAEVGPNELIDRGVKSPWKILWEQFAETLVIVLVVAAVVSAFLGEYPDAIAIMAIVILNALLGLRQEYRAEKAMAALKKLATPVIRVRREGHVEEISATEVVPGDIVLLEAGGAVPADGRVLTSFNLRIDEAALTGESETVEKQAAMVYDTDLALGDRRNMVYMGTVATYGHGEILIVATGMQTELGRIADLIQNVEHEPTPLQRRLDQLGRSLAIIALLIVIVIFLLGIWQGLGWEEMLLTAVSMAVAAVPEGLPAVVTIALALGAQRMLKRHALIRKLPAVETLGSVTIICSDKTGTLTENQMTVTVLDVAGEHLDLTEHITRSRHGTVSVVEYARPEAQPALGLLLAGSALCNDAIVEPEAEQEHAFRVVGDPTEGALAVAAARTGLLKGDLDQLFPRINEVPFDSTRKRMTTVHQTPPSGGALPDELQPISRWMMAHDAPPFISFTKGAMDSLLDISTRVWIENQVEPMQPEHRERIVASHDRLAGQGMRVLAVALRPLASEPTDEEMNTLEGDLVFVGLAAMIDPPRAEVADAVKTCLTAGIRPMMITGDHPLTARHIATQLHIMSEAHNTLITGQQLEQMSEAELDQAVREVSVFARVSPEHKLNIVEALQKQGHVVAMTGDGVNDAPALKKADMGVAMGITGTDVAKEASDMILQDDNFATIVASVEEGRTIYDNVRKFIKYLLSCNSGELWVMLVGLMAGMPLPLVPLQILWMNLVTDGLPALALGVEPAEPNIMKRQPYPPAESVFSRGVGRDIIWVGLLMALAPLLIGYLYWSANPDGPWRTMVFTTLTLGQMSLALTFRSERESIFKIGLLSNQSMLAAVALTLVLQLGVIYLPFAQTLFDTEALSAIDLAIALVLSTLPFWGVELQKWIERRSMGQAQV